MSRVFIKDRSGETGALVLWRPGGQKRKLGRKQSASDSTSAAAKKAKGATGSNDLQITERASRYR